MPFFAGLALLFVAYLLVGPLVALVQSVAAGRKADDLGHTIDRLSGRLSKVENDVRKLSQAQANFTAAAGVDVAAAAASAEREKAAEREAVREAMRESAREYARETARESVRDADAVAAEPVVIEPDRERGHVSDRPGESIPLEPMREKPVEIVAEPGAAALPMQTREAASDAGSITSGSGSDASPVKPHAQAQTAPHQSVHALGASPAPAIDRDASEPVKRATSSAQHRAAAPPHITGVGAERDRRSASFNEAPTKESLERWFMLALPWVGAVALGMAGLFAVKVMNDYGWIGPAVRVAGATIVALLLVGLAQRVHATSQRIAQAMVGSGVLTLYGVVLACNGLYASDPWIGLTATQAMAGIAAVTAAAVVLSLRHSSMVALVGLLGGFLAPSIVMPGESFGSVFFVYLLGLEVALAVVASRNRWWWVTLLSMVAGLGWAAGWTALCFTPELSPTVGLFVMGSVLVFVAAGVSQTTTENKEDPDVEEVIMRLLPTCAVIAGLVLSAWLTGMSAFAPTQWFMFGALSLGAIVLERLRPAQRGLALSALIASVTLLVGRAWHVDEDAEQLSRLGWPLLGFAIVHAAGGYLAHWRSDKELRWAGHSVLSAIVMATVAQCLLIDHGVQLHVPWSMVLAAAAVGYALTTAVAQSRRVMTTDDTTANTDKAVASTRDDVTALFALASTAMAAWAVARLASEQGFSAETTAVAWSIQVLLLAMTARWLRLPKLLDATPWFACAAMVRLVINPGFLTGRLGEGVISLALLWTYGVPAACMAATAAILRNERKPDLFKLMSCGAYITTLAMLTLLVRHGFHVNDFWAFRVALTEWVTLGLVWGAMAVAGWELSRKLTIEPMRDIGFTVGWVGVAALLLGPLLLANPVFTGDPVGATPVFNELLYAYGLPAALAWWAAWWIKRRGDAHASAIVQGVAVVLALVFVTLEVRQAFQGTTLDGPSPDNREWYAYSAAWIVSSGLLMLAGLLRKSVVLRHAAMGVMVASVLKVFLFDTRHLTDLWRVLSYFGLGVSLLLLAWVYQRFVFGSSSDKADNSSNAEPTEPGPQA